MGPADQRDETSYSALRAQADAEYERSRPAQMLQNVGLTCSCLLMLLAGWSVVWLVLRCAWIAVCRWGHGG